jgi:hypothetical protein
MINFIIVPICMRQLLDKVYFNSPIFSISCSCTLFLFLFVSVVDCSFSFLFVVISSLLLIFVLVHFTGIIICFIVVCSCSHYCYLLFFIVIALFLVHFIVLSLCTLFSNTFNCYLFSFIWLPTYCKNWKFWDFHGGYYEECLPLRYYTVWLF